MLSLCVRRGGDPFLRADHFVHRGTAEKDEVCQEPNLAPGGGTCRSFVVFLNPAMLRSSATVTLSCTSGRRAGDRVRRLQTDFLIVSSVYFAQATDATNFSERVNGTSSEMASAFQSDSATTLGVHLSAIVAAVELTATDDASACVSNNSEVVCWY